MDKLPNANDEKNHGATSLLPQAGNPRDPYNLFYPHDLDELNDFDDPCYLGLDNLTDEEILDIIDVFPGCTLLITVQSIIRGMAEAVARKTENWDVNEDYDYTKENPEITVIEMERISPGSISLIAEMAFGHVPSERLRLAIDAEVRELTQQAVEEIEPEDHARLVNASRKKVLRRPRPVQAGERVGDKAARSRPETRPRSVKKTPCGPPGGNRRPESHRPPTRPGRGRTRPPKPAAPQPAYHRSRPRAEPSPSTDSDTPQGGPACRHPGLPTRWHADMGMMLGIGAATIAIPIMWTDLDLPQETGPARSEQAAPAPAEQMTLAPTAVHAAPGGTPQPAPRRAGFKPAVRYEALMPGSNNQAFSNARKERHSESRELRTELLVQLDTLDLQAQFQEGVQLNTEGNFREGEYVRFVFDDAEGTGRGHPEHDQKAAPLLPRRVHPPEGPSKRPTAITDRTGRTPNSAAVPLPIRHCRTVECLESSVHAPKLKPRQNAPGQGLTREPVRPGRRWTPDAPQHVEIRHGRDTRAHRAHARFHVRKA